MQYEGTGVHRSENRPLLTVKVLISVFVVLCALAIGFLGPHWLLPDHPPVEENSAAADAAAERPTIVEISPEKQAAAQIHTTFAASRQLQEKQTVPGTITYDDETYLELRVPLDCVVSRVFVKHGDHVARGDKLALLSSPEIGTARNDERRAETDLQLAKSQHDWAAETSQNLQELIASLAQQPAIEEIIQRFSGKTMGKYRSQILAAYSDLQLAVSNAQRSHDLSANGLLSGRSQEERQAQAQIAAAEFQGRCEQARFESQQVLAQASADLELTERRLAVSQTRVQSLLGPFAESSDSQSLSDFIIRAPFSGSVEDQRMVPSARVMASEVLLLLADTRELWVLADIHQRNWRALDVPIGEVVSIQTPASLDGPESARVHFVGAQVSPGSRAIPLVAELDNSSGKYRPGMFAWVTVPVSRPRETLVVPTSAVQRHENQTFVFVRGGPRMFRRVDISIGLETDDWTEVTEGLQSGDELVDGGAFFLKSELLLERETE